MNTVSIISIVLSSSLLSATLTGFITWLIKRYDFRQEYYKELIKRRVECYEHIENFLGGFTIVGYVREDGSRYYNCMVDEKTYLDVFIGDLGIAIKFSMWINNETCKLLGKFNSFALEYNQLIVGRDINSKEDEEKMILQASSYYLDIQKLKDELKISVMKDLKKLHKLDFSEFGV